MSGGRVLPHLIFRLVVVPPLLAASLLIATGSASAAPSPTASAAGFLDLSVAVDNNPPQVIGDQIGLVTAPPSNSANLTGDQTRIGFGEQIIAQAASIATSADVGQRSAAKSVVTAAVISTAAGNLQLNNIWSSVNCPVNGPATADAGGPTTVSVNGIVAIPDQSGRIVAPAIGRGVVGTVIITLNSPQPKLSPTSATASGLFLTVQEELTAPTATSRTISLTVAQSSCSPPLAPMIDSLSPAAGSGSQQTEITVLGSGFVPDQTSVVIGTIKLSGNQIQVSPDGTSLKFLTPMSQPPGTVSVTVSTPAGESKSLPFQYSASRTMSGVLRDAATGAPLNRGCVLIRPAGTTRWFTTGTGDFGKWSFDSDEPGPFALGFYASPNGDCNHINQTSPVPSWYRNQPLTGTDPSTALPPRGTTEVPAGTTDIVACLGENALPTGECAIPTGVLSGRVTGQLAPGPTTPVAGACVVVLAGGPTQGMVWIAVSGADGSWRAENLPINTPMAVAVLPPFGGPDGPAAPVIARGRRSHHPEPCSRCSIGTRSPTSPIRRC